MKDQKSPEEQKSFNRIFSGRGMKTALLVLFVLFPLIALFFITLAILNSNQVVQPQTQANKISRALTSLALQEDAPSLPQGAPAISSPAELTSSRTDEAAAARQNQAAAPSGPGSGPVKPQIKPDDANKNNAAWQQLDLGESEKIVLNEKSGGALNKIAELKSKRVETAAVKPPEKPAAIKQEPAPKQISPVNAATARLAILNESGQPDLGQVYKEVIEAMGFRVVLVKDQPRKPGPTAIYYKPGAKLVAADLNERIPGEKTMASITWASQFDIVVFVR